eukprot:scaffold246157_cov16-Tisochrysis_lutea.AAC.1
MASVLPNGLDCGTYVIDLRLMLAWVELTVKGPVLLSSWEVEEEVSGMTWKEFEKEAIKKKLYEAV